VPERADDGHLPPEPVGVAARRDRRREDLHGHPPPVGRARRGEDADRAARPDLTLDGVAGAFINVFDTWSTSARVKDLLTGHTDMREPTYGSTRVTVYLDPRDLVHLREGQRLLEHVRTEFVRTGAPPPPTAGGSAP
jgi:hypothetical protein